MGQKTISVLIIDDEPANIILLESILENQGYTVFSAGNGPEGRKIARRTLPNLILLDIMMPGENGFETCLNLQQDPTTSDIPVVFISAMDDPESKVKGLSMGGWDFITRPFHKEEILARVKNYLKLQFTYLRIISEQAQRLQQLQEAQQAILVKPGELPDAQFSVSYIPVLEAGGDFYDVFEVSKGVYGYFVADISGHDLGASFATSALKALIRQNSSQLYAPDETIRMINKILTSIFKPGQYLTAVYATIDRRHQSVELVNAGHVSVLFMPMGKNNFWLEPDSDVIGAFADGYYSTRSVTVSSGDRLLLFSDGVIESFLNGGRTREAGIERLTEAAVLTRGSAVSEVAAAIRERLLPAGQPAEDDFLLMVIDV